MSTTTVGVVTAVNSGKRNAGHLEQFTSGMDFEDKYTTNIRHDPRKGDFPSFVPECRDDRLSVRHFGQEVHIGYKDPRSRALTSVELISICEVMLSLIHPSNYPTATKALRKMSEEAAVCRDKWYTTFVNEVTKQTKFTQ
eukprot:4885320-Amphidinium_carterae.1